MIEQEVLNIMARAIVHANTEFGGSSHMPTWDEMTRINDEGDRLASVVLDALHAAGYVVAKN